MKPRCDLGRSLQPQRELKQAFAEFRTQNFITTSSHGMYVPLCMLERVQLLFSAKLSEKNQNHKRPQTSKRNSVGGPMSKERRLH